MSHEYDRAISEISENMFRYVVINFDEKYLLSRVKSHKEAAKILNKEVFSLDDIPKEQWEKDNQWIENQGITKSNPFLKYIYLRKLKGGWKAKIMFGISNLPITNN